MIAQLSSIKATRQNLVKYPFHIFTVEFSTSQYVYGIYALTSL